MIYTHGLDRSTNHIIIYDGNTPIEVVKLYFWYTTYPIIHPDECDENGWIERVDKLLLQYSEKSGIDKRQLSAKPVKIKDQVEITR